MGILSSFKGVSESKNGRHLGGGAVLSGISACLCAE